MLFDRSMVRGKSEQRRAGRGREGELNLCFTRSLCCVIQSNRGLLHDSYTSSPPAPIPPPPLPTPLDGGWGWGCLSLSHHPHTHTHTHRGRQGHIAWQRHPERTLKARLCHNSTVITPSDDQGCLSELQKVPLLLRQTTKAVWVLGHSHHWRPHAQRSPVFHGLHGYHLTTQAAYSDDPWKPASVGREWPICPWPPPGLVQFPCHLRG